MNFSLFLRQDHSRGLSAQYGEPSHNFVNLFDLPPSQSYGNFNVHFLYSSRRLKTIPLTTQGSFMALYVLFIPPE